MGAALAYSTLKPQSVNSASSDFTKIKLILCVSLFLWMKRGFAVKQQNLNNSKNSGQKLKGKRK